MGQEFQTTRQSDPCPICDDITGKCRLLQSDLTLCMNVTSSTNVPGWRFTKLTKNKLWGIWAPDEKRKGSPEDWKQEQRQRQENRDRRKEFQRKNSLKPAQRNRYYRQLLANLTLHPDDRADLHSRDFTDQEIAIAGFKSVEQWQKLDIELPINLPGVAPSGTNLLTSGAGYLCPIPDHKGRIVGMQLRLREVKGKEGRYRWLSSTSKKRSNGAGPAMRDGENPLPIIGAGQFSGTIFLAEGTGAKPWLTYQRLQQPVVGAAGGLWGSSAETLRVSLQAISQQPPSKTEIVFIPDAGDAANHKVRGRNQATFKALADLGYQVKVMWWGQVLKADPDVDERPARSPYKLISVDEFWEICDRERISAPAREDQAKINALTYKPDLLVAQKRLPDLHLPKPGRFLFISSPMGSGKSYQTDRLIKEFKQLRAEGLIRLFGCRNSLLRQLTNTLQIANPTLNIDLIHDLGGAGMNTASMVNTYDVVGLCVDSLLRIDVDSLNGGLIFLDEVDSTLRHLLIGNTCDRNREEIMMHFQAIIQRVLSTGGYVVAAEANVTDLTIDTLRGLAPEAPMTLIVNEGTSDPWDVTILTEASAVINHALEGYKQGLKQAIATDSQKYAEQIEGVIAELFPEANIIRVDRKTSERDDIRALITSPNEVIEARKPDFFIYTPTLESGTDITTSFFDRQLFYFVNLETR
ncbi:MAG: hypothetical protein ACR2FS_17530, partial [Phormidesmis sp.]